MTNIKGNSNRRRGQLGNLLTMPDTDPAPEAPTAPAAPPAAPPAEVPAVAPVADEEPADDTPADDTSAPTASAPVRKPVRRSGRAAGRGTEMDTRGAPALLPRTRARRIPREKLTVNIPVAVLDGLEALVNRDDTRRYDEVEAALRTHLHSKGITLQEES